MKMELAQCEADVIGSEVPGSISHSSVQLKADNNMNVVPELLECAVGSALDKENKPDMSLICTVFYIVLSTDYKNRTEYLICYAFYRWIDTPPHHQGTPGPLEPAGE